MTVTKKITLVQVDCCVCDIVYAVPDYWQAKRLEDGAGFFCPNGHSLSYTDAENKKLRREVEQLQAKLTHERDQRLAAQLEVETAVKEAQRARQRIGNGVCPCCKRSFANLGRHMKGQHPDYAGVR